MKTVQCVICQRYVGATGFNMLQHVIEHENCLLVGFQRHSVDAVFNVVQRSATHPYMECERKKKKRDND